MVQGRLLLSIPSFLLVSALAIGCSNGGGSGGESSTEPETQPSFEVRSNIKYVSYGATSLVLDLFLPTNQGSGPFPAVVFIFGGAWTNGNRGQLSPQARYLAPKGFIGATISHRFAPEHSFPAALHDVKAAVRWLRANAGTYNIDPTRIGMVGASSGGHLAALVGTTEGNPEFEGDGNPGFSSAVRAVAAFNPPLDLVGLNSSPQAWVVEVVEDLMGATYADDPDAWVNASPISHVSATAAPLLLLHGTGDEDIPYQQSVEMQSMMTEAGAHVELFRAQGATHGFFNSEPWLSQCNAALEDFFTRMFN